MREDILTMEVPENINFGTEDYKNWIKTDLAYTGQLDTPKKELEDSINKLVQDFQNKYNVIVQLQGKDTLPSVVDICLVIDTTKSIYSQRSTSI